MNLQCFFIIQKCRIYTISMLIFIIECVKSQFFYAKDFEHKHIFALQRRFNPLIQKSALKSQIQYYFVRVCIPFVSTFNVLFNQEVRKMHIKESFYEMHL